MTDEERALADELDAHARRGRTLPLQFAARRRGKPPRHWADLAPDERVAAVVEAGWPKFRASQLSHHYFAGASDDPASWTDLPQGLRADVAERFFPTLLTPVRALSTDSGTTTKTLWRLHDGSLVESVLMQYGVPGVPASGSGRRRSTLCVSSQAGCGMACPFCATGQGGLQRNLSAGEIVAQVTAAAKEVGHLNNVVFMGMGEPMANYKALMRSIRTMTDDMGMSARGITVSTVGLVPRIRQLATEGLPLTLAVSLHAPDDELRDEIVPINTRFDVGEAVEAAHDYFEATGRRVSIEYALIRDINDQSWRADALADVLVGHGRGTGWVHVNLIPLNPTPGSKWTASRREDEAAFVRRLEARHVAVTVRDTRGREIDGACGQLAASEA
ncbi:23S rRNA (adenine(2503)-C(2))-methyltransferase RlmN [Nigerium sp.]|uniref:23S rRNA (adenine(2503)-C(2))-methyltransferase RlmN n=1 Tax=Nigerium sp. TaxID=2042655 RepID=UPI003221B1F0